MNNKIFIIVILLFIRTIPAGDPDMRSYELTYAYKGSIAGDSLNAIITCRPVKDTLINSIDVLKYRFVKTTKDSSDTSFEYLHITDTSVVNYAYRGNTPFVLLKRSAAEDSLVLEETPYTTFAFSYLLNAKWLTRPDSTGLYSVKEYVGQEDLTVVAGSFFCNKVHTDILVALTLKNLYSDQWSAGNTVVKSYIDEGVNEISDSSGTVIGTFWAWESFELISFKFIGAGTIHHNGMPAKTIPSELGRNSRPRLISLNGRAVKNGAAPSRGIFITIGNEKPSIYINQKR
jgi:hypothetical protein